MAALQRVASSLSTTASSYGQCKAGHVVVSDQFPVGLRVLVVDDDTACLKILEHMLRRLLYQVTCCTQATVALNILRERKGCFDIVLSDVYMPAMDGYKLLEHVGLEMDLPVIMMSADGRTSAVMRGIEHGACDYLIKPLREEELKNIWQHVIRKKCNESKEREHCGSLEDNDRHKQGSDDVCYASSVNERTEGILKGQKKQSSGNEEDNGELESDDPSAAKKPRVVWSVELHQQFVSAVNQCGIDKAVPKRILELMNVPGLTRENVASHLQKFRLYLKRLSGMVQQGGMSNPLCGPVDSNVKLSGHGRFDIQALAASGQIPPQTLAALQTELLGRSTGSLFTIMDQPALLQASMQGSKCMPVEHGVSFGQPLVKCQSNISKHLQNMPSTGEVVSGFGVWPSNSLGQVGSSANLGGMDTQNCNILMDILQQQQQQQHLQKQQQHLQKQQQHLQKQQQQPQQSSLPETSRSITVQPSCLVVPSQSLASSRAGSSHASVNQKCSFSRAAAVDNNFLSPQSNPSLNIGHMSDGLIKTVNVISDYSATGPVSPAASSCFKSANNGATQQVQNPTMTFGAARSSLGTVPNICDIQGSYGAKSSEVLDQGLLKNLGFVGNGMCIPSQFVVDGCEPPMGNFNNRNINVEKNVNKVKEERDVEFVDNARVGLPVLPQFPPNNLMGVFTE